MTGLATTTDTGFLQRHLWNPHRKTVGLQFLVLGMASGCLGSALALIIRFQLAWPDQQVVRPETYLSFVTLHGTLMLFFVVAPMLVSGFGILLIPSLIGADDLAHPRLAQASLWCQMAALVLLLISTQTVSMGSGSGWTAFAPLSAVPQAAPGSGAGQTLWLWAMALFVVSFLLVSFNFAKTILTRRDPRIPLRDLSLWIWTMLASAVLALISFPVMLLAIGMLLCDRQGATSFFVPGELLIAGGVDQHSGGNPLLFQQLFWFFGHPARFVLVLPAVGVAFEIISTCTRRRPFGYGVSVAAVTCVAAGSLLTWGQHLFLSDMTGTTARAVALGSALHTAAVLVLVVNLTASLWGARLTLTPPMLYAVSLISALTIGGLGAWYLTSPTTSVFLQGTQFIVGHFHTLVATVTLLAILGGIHFWFPTICGRQLNPRLAVWHFWLTVIPVFTLFGLLHGQGLAGVLRRLYDPQVYEYGQQALNLNPAITIAAMIATAAQLLFVWNLIHSVRRGTPASTVPGHAWIDPPAD